MLDYEDLLGKPYGVGPGEYICWTLVQECFRRIGEPLPDDILIANLEPIERDELYYRLRGSSRWPRLTKPTPNSIVVFRTEHIHVGFMLDTDKFLHIRAPNLLSPSPGVCVERLSSPLFRNIIDGFYRRV